MLKLTFLIRCKTPFIQKAILGRSVSDARFQESLKYRILNYFDTTRKSDQYQTSAQLREIVPTFNDDFVDHNKDNKLKTLYQEFEIISMKKDMFLVKETIGDLDIKCFSLINSLKCSEILSLMIEFFKIAPSEFTRSYFYDKSIIVLIKAAEEKCLTNYEIVQLLYFISLNEEKGASYVDYLKPLLPDLNELTLFEKCITAQTFYKTSTKLQLRQSRLLEELVEKDFDQLIADPILLVTICKAIMISDTSNELTLKNLSQAIIELKEPLHFNSTVHILRLYAESLLFEPKLIDQLVKYGIDNIFNDLVDCKNTLSLSNIDTFLWSISYLGITLTLNEKMILRTCVEKRLEEYKTKENLGYLVNSLLCLHMLRSWSTKVIISCFKEQTFQPIFHKKFHWKVQSRLQLLMSQISLEMKMHIPCSLSKQIMIGYTPSQNLQAVAEVGYGLVGKEIVKNAIIECPIKTLIIPGVTITTKKEKYHIDVLDNTTCLKNTNVPNGLTNLKLRLLSRLRYRQILIPGQIFKENVENAQSIVEKEIIHRIKYGQASNLISESIR